ncbi:hypothetical protein E1211_17835 [Micromonospora sp. 15K316]|uniref:hypothetical protein n=1 Tax=Micromonospora sp. 15K316 TaxID=2530376 RepID=UPI00104A288D|nr:hypothetical protein [Micromonospora sp. 15K316]TDC34209.1 hypothetical protein E1211_17835 [Micromonospora sp. 15K316]
MDHIDRIREARQARDEAVERATEALHAAIADAVRDKAPVEQVAAAAGYHRNHVGRIARERGVPDARTLRRKDES